MPSDVVIGARRIGPGAPCFIIAEAGVNHNGSLDRALEMVEVAAEAGADAVKFQTFNPDRLVLRSEAQHEMLKALRLTADDHVQLMARCKEAGILFMSTPFDDESADFLAELGVAVFKLPSGEITNTAFLAHVASFCRPLIVSTGMASLAEVDEAVQAIRATGNDDLVLLHCVSAYPAAAADANLRAMATMAAHWDVPIGYSDHTLGIAVGLAAAALGACVLEKHFTLDTTLPGPDHRASLEPPALVELVLGVREVESALGDGRKEPRLAEDATAAIARKSLIASCTIEEGTAITAAHLVAMRPGTGLSPAVRDRVVGRLARIQIPAGTMLTWEMLA